MPEQLLKHFSIDIKNTLYSAETPEGKIAVFETIPFGKLLTLNDQVLLSENDSFFYHEMLTHPALFTHPQPQNVSIIGNGFGILQEVLKHTNVSSIVCTNCNTLINDVVVTYFPQNSLSTDPRITHHSLGAQPFLAACKESYDVIIETEANEHFLARAETFCRLLNEDGILVLPSQSSLFQLKTLKPIYQDLEKAGFHDMQIIHFPQPSYPNGWRLLVMATKGKMFKKIQEKNIFNRQFSTRYYNFDTHKAACVLPEFVRE